MELYGVPYGIKTLTLGYESLVDGLSTCRYVLVNTLSTNLGNVILRSKNGAGTGAGFHLQAGDPPIRVDIRRDNSLIQVAASAVGTTVCYLGVEQDAT